MVFYRSSMLRGGVELRGRRGPASGPEKREKKNLPKKKERKEG